MSTRDVAAADTSGPGATRPSSTSDLLGDVGIVLAGFVVTGVLAGLVWWRLVDLPRATRESGAVVEQADQLGKQVNIDGWFLVLALVVGLLSGLLLLFWRERDPLAMVVLVTLGGGLAAYLASKVGHALGPGSAAEALRHRANGAHALMPLQVHASGVYWAWPAAAALGALIYLWIIKSPESE
jgi:hypothetical protein